MVLLRRLGRQHGDDDTHIHVARLQDHTGCPAEEGLPLTVQVPRILGAAPTAPSTRLTQQLATGGLLLRPGGVCSAFGDPRLGIQRHCLLGLQRLPHEEGGLLGQVPYQQEAVGGEHQDGQGGQRRGDR